MTLDTDEKVDPETWKRMQKVWRTARSVDHGFRKQEVIRLSGKRRNLGIPRLRRMYRSRQK